VAFTPDGTRAYVSNYDGSSVSVINTASDEVTGYLISVGDGPSAVAFTPDGTRAYVTNNLAGSVSVINTTTNSVVGNPIAVIDRAAGLAITPDGTRAYVTNPQMNNPSSGRVMHSYAVKAIDAGNFSGSCRRTVDVMTSW
jgi:YVTN family beta-propeller protein